MARRRFQTSQGEIWLSGDEGAFERGPILLAITGALATDTNSFFNLQPFLPGADVLVGHLPGNLSPALRETSVAAFAEAYGEVLTQLGRPAVVLGESAGALVALAMRSTWIKALVLLEPPLVTAPLWPLIEVFRPLLASPEHRDFIVNVFGYGESGIEGRDYRDLLEDLTTPTRIFLGSAPLGEPRPVTANPSLVRDSERELLQSHRWIRTTTVNGAGHNLVAAADQKIADACEDFLTRLAR